MRQRVTWSGAGLMRTIATGEAPGGRLGSVVEGPLERIGNAIGPPRPGFMGARKPPARAS